MRIRSILITAIVCVLASAAPALASSTETSIFEPGVELDGDPTGTLHTLRLLGAREIRLVVHWNEIAPSPNSHTAPHGFNASNPASYPAAGWSLTDTIIEDAAKDGIAVDLDVSGRAPLWAMPKSAPVSAQGSLDPSPSAFGQFVQAVGKRYTGSYRPSGASSRLPKVTTWSLWNEPNYQSSLLPQGSGHDNVNPVSPGIYRNLVAAGWKGLAASGHGHNTILIGELAPRGYPADFKGYMFPVLFVRSLYCVGSDYRPLTGASARSQSCPTTASGTHAFARNNPGLFSSTGFSAHLYSNYGPPDGEFYKTCVHSGLCASLGDVSDLTGALDRSIRAYGSHKRYEIYDTEYGYQTAPPRKPGYGVVSQATAATDLNWAEYLSWKNPRIASFDQYQLTDPIEPTKANDFGNDGNYASGIETWNNKPKASYYAWRLPLYLPKTRGRRLEVWGCARPAPYASIDTGGSPQTVNVQFAAGGSSSFKTVATVKVANRMGYFDTHVTFPGSGTVRLTYTYPGSDMQLAPGYTTYSRHVTITG
jgi:hypothetical protein